MASKHSLFHNKFCTSSTLCVSSDFFPWIALQQWLFWHIRGVRSLLIPTSKWSFPVSALPELAFSPHTSPLNSGPATFLLWLSGFTWRQQREAVCEPVRPPSPVHPHHTYEHRQAPCSFAACLNNTDAVCTWPWDPRRPRKVTLGM